MVKHLSNDEKATIIAWAELNQSASAIAKRTGRDRTTIKRFLDRYSVQKTPETKSKYKKLTDRDVRRIAQLALKPQMSARTICRDLNLNVTVRRVRQILQSNPNLSYARVPQAIHLSMQHKNKRIAFATEHLGNARIDWQKVIFSDAGWLECSLDRPHEICGSSTSPSKRRCWRHDLGCHFLSWCCLFLKMHWKR